MFCENESVRLRPSPSVLWEGSAPDGRADGRRGQADEDIRMNSAGHEVMCVLARSLAIPTSFQLAYCIKHNPYREANMKMTKGSRPQLHVLHPVCGESGLPLLPQSTFHTCAALHWSLITYLSFKYKYEVSPAAPTDRVVGAFPRSLYSTFEFNPSAPPLPFLPNPVSIPLHTYCGCFPALQ